MGDHAEVRAVTKIRRHRSDDGRGARLGRRLRDARASLELTLKDVEASSGLSATHISEIERCRTSPTIGALVRIAAALGKEPAFFLDAEPTRTFACSRDAVRIREIQRTATTPLSAPALGTRLEAGRFELCEGGRTTFDAGAERCGYVLSGRTVLTVGERTWELGAGDAFHSAPGDACTMEAPAESATLIIVTHRP